MSKVRFIILMSLICAVSSLFGQSASFVNYTSDARLAGLGNAGYAVESAFAVNRNAASIMAETADYFTISASHLSWQPKLTHSSTINAAGYTKGESFGFLFGFSYNNLDEISRVNELGNIEDNFKPKELQASLGAAYKINASLSAGLSARYIYSDMGGEKAASAFAGDLSVLFEQADLRLLAGISNIGTKINYGNDAYALPTRIFGGGAYQLNIAAKQDVLFAADIAYQLTPSYSGLIAGLGAEYAFNKMIFARGGYHFESKKVGAAHATAGVGVNFAGFKLDFAYLIANKTNPMHQTMLISVGWGL